VAARARMREGWCNRPFELKFVVDGITLNRRLRDGGCSRARPSRERLG
jgi:hypothetical protein